jgi:adenosylcobinamide-GDP ribazoletransferase
VVGLLLGLILYGTALLWELLSFSDWPAACALILLAGGVWLTRGLHLDGLADWADSMGGHGREKRLAIMKDVSLGAFGVMALTLALLIKWVLYQRLVVSGTIIWIIPSLILSRSMLVELQTTLPYARAEGGMAGPFIEGAAGKHRTISHGVTLVLCLCFGPMGLILYATAWLFVRVFRSRCRKQFGGITGDLLGTANEMVETLVLFVCALLGKDLVSHVGWSWIF